MSDADLRGTGPPQRRGTARIHPEVLPRLQITPVPATRECGSVTIETTTIFDVYVLNLLHWIRASEAMPRPLATPLVTKHYPYCCQRRSHTRQPKP